MYSLSEIETTSKRASKAAGYSWGMAEEIGKATSSLELFGLQDMLNQNITKKSFLQVGMILT